MNESPVVIDDDDIVMVESVDIIDDDENNIMHQNSRTAISVEKAVLDNDCLPAHINNETGNSVLPLSNKATTGADKEQSFVISLKNNTLMNKIVQRCLNMSNNAGMPRVVHKTLLPLYDDVNKKFKESEYLSEFLNKILHKLKHDPDHKFLHIKYLCEELKERRFKKIMPFATLNKYLKKKPKRCVQKTLVDGKLKRKSNRNKKTDVIDLDNSDEESIITLDSDDDSDTNIDDIMVIEEIGSDVESEQSNKENSELVEGNHSMVTRSKTGTSNAEIRIDSNKNGEETNKNRIETEDNRNERSKRVIETNKNEIQKINGMTEIYRNGIESNKNIIESDKNRIASDKNILESDENSIESDNAIIESYENSIELDKNSIEPSTNRAGTDENRYEAVNNSKTAGCPDYDHLIPHNSIDYNLISFNRAVAIEKQIEFCKKQITYLEEEEVTHNYSSSPYIQCDRYKAKIVELYKKLCKLTGNGDVNLLKQRVVRLSVVEGHPPGPVQRLERFLNSTIDETGVVPLPDFHDVIRCVTESNTVDNLGWTKQDIMKEALALFTNCGQALRKERQKREYKDLLSLVKDKELDDYDPANNDPLLSAKLEQNKHIAKINEREVLDRFVKMENLPRGSAISNSTLKPVTNSDTGSDTDSDLTPQKKVKRKIIPLHCNKTRRESSEKHNDSNVGCAVNCVSTSKEHEISDQNPNQNIKDLSDLFTQNLMNTINQSSTNIIDGVTNKTRPTYTAFNTLQKIGDSNRYVIAYNSETSHNHETNVIENYLITPKEPDDKENFTVKSETTIKEEPIDVQRLLNELGDNYIATIFDIEDPFLVIDISDSSDDEL